MSSAAWAAHRNRTDRRQERDEKPAARPARPRVPRPDPGPARRVGHQGRTAGRRRVHRPGPPGGPRRRPADPLRRAPETCSCAARSPNVWSPRPATPCPPRDAAIARRGTGRRSRVAGRSRRPRSPPPRPSWPSLLPAQPVRDADLACPAGASYEHRITLPLSAIRDRWPGPRQIYRASGLSPMQYESAGNRRDGAISREGSVALRRALIDLGIGLWLNDRPPRPTPTASRPAASMAASSPARWPIAPTASPTPSSATTRTLRTDRTGPEPA